MGSFGLCSSIEFLVTFYKSALFLLLSHRHQAEFFYCLTYNVCNTKHLSSLFARTHTKGLPLCLTFPTDRHFKFFLSTQTVSPNSVRGFELGIVNVEGKHATPSLHSDVVVGCAVRPCVDAWRWKGHLVRFCALFHLVQKSPQSDRRRERQS